MAISGVVMSAFATGIFRRGTQSIPITVDTAINLGAVATPTLLAIVNMDPTNFVTIKNQSAGKVIAKLLPGKGCLIPCGSDLTVPTATADSGACIIDVFAA